MIKEIGTSARIDIEKLLGKKVYLELFVKTVKKWRQKEKYLNEGFNNCNNNLEIYSYDYDTNLGFTKDEIEVF